MAQRKAMSWDLQHVRVTALENWRISRFWHLVHLMLFTSFSYVGVELLCEVPCGAFQYPRPWNPSFGVDSELFGLVSQTLLEGFPVGHNQKVAGFLSQVVFWAINISDWCYNLIIYGCLCFWSSTLAQFWKIKSLLCNPLRQEYGRHNVVRLAFVWCFDSVGWYLFDWTRCNRFGLERHRLDPTAQPGFQWQNESCIRMTYQKWFVILVMTGILVGGVDPRYRECFVLDSFGQVPLCQRLLACIIFTFPLGLVSSYLPQRVSSRLCCDFPDWQGRKMLPPGGYRFWI